MVKRETIFTLKETLKTMYLHLNKKPRLGDKPELKNYRITSDDVSVRPIDLTIIPKDMFKKEARFL